MNKAKFDLIVRFRKMATGFASIVFFLAAASICFQSTANADWTIVPGVFNTPFGPNGPDGVPGTMDDRPLGTIGILSGYFGGSYIGPAGVPLTADVAMASWAFPVAGGWQYNWLLTNSGTGPFVTYVDTGGGPVTFLQDDGILWGTAGPDRIPLTPDDLAPESDFEMRIAGGPPIIGFWGGAWNPEVGLDAMRVQPVPEPSAFLLFGIGIGVVGFIGYGQRQRNRAISS